MIPPSEGSRIDGMTWVSSKWPARAPQDLALVRVFFGGPHTREMLDLDDAALLALVREELAAILGVRAAPLFQRIFRCARWLSALYGRPSGARGGHRAALPSRTVRDGRSYRGVGVPDCVHQGQEAASQPAATRDPRRSRA